MKVLDMQILVTGGAGYIGCHIVDLLCELGFDVIVLDNLSTGSKQNLNSKAKFVFGDITKKDELENIFSRYSIDSIIHMAALKSVAESMNNPTIYTENNIVGSINLISVAIKFKVQKFVFSSTAAVYGNSEMEAPVDETHKVQPINHYGYTKLYVENYLKWISKLEHIKFVAFRYFNVAGYSTKKDLIKIKEKSPKNLLPIIMEVANNRRASLNIFGNDYNTKDGTCIRDYIHVLDLADAHVKAISYLDNNQSSTMNLSTGVGYSVLEAIKIAEEVTERSILYNLKERREGDSPILISTFNKANRLLGWVPKYSIDDIISSMWKLYKSDLK